MSQHGCPERLSNRSKGFQDEGGSQPTMEVLVETLTGTAFEMTVSPSDTIFAIKSKIYRVEGIPVAQQHLLYNLKELEDWSSLGEHSIGDGAKLRLVLGMRGGPISTRRLPPPPAAEPWRDIERLLDADREEGEWSGSGCKVTVVVFRDGERVNMLRVRENHDGTYSPVEHNKYTSALRHLAEKAAESGAGVAVGGSGGETVGVAVAGGGGVGDGDGEGDGAGSLRENAVTMGKMMELRRRMETLSLTRPDHHARTDKVEIQKTRSEETLSVPSLLDDSADPFKLRTYTPYSEAEDSFAPLYDGKYTRYDYDCTYPDRYTLLPPIGTRADSNQSVQEAVDSERLKLSDALAGSILVKGRRERDEDAAILEECLDTEECRLRRDSPPLVAKNLAPISAAEYAGGCVWRCPCAHSQSSSALHARRAATRRPHHHHQQLADALFSSSTSDLENLKRNSSRILPALSRHRNREHLHLSDDGLDLTRTRTRARTHARTHADNHTTTTDNTTAPDNTTADSTNTSSNTSSNTNTNTNTDDKTVEPPPPPPPAPAPPAPTPPAPAEVKKPRLRCGLCRKRLSIATVHSCRCGARFCAAHRYAEVHGCAYDYKAGAATLLRHHNPLVTAPKLPKI